MEKVYIKIIVEGNEEETFFEIVKEIGTNDVFYIEIENAHGFGQIADYFLTALREDELYDCVVCVYDVDGKIDEPNSPYNIIRKQLNNTFGDETITDKVSFCTNPNILQLFLLAADTLDKTKLSTSSKQVNTEFVHRYRPKIASRKSDSMGRIKKQYYDASAWQLDIIKYSILDETYPYDTLLKNAEKLSENYKDIIPASNLPKLLIALKNGDINFFSSIRHSTEKFLDYI